jgi:phospholipase/lecithinase/hemolysin
MNTASQALTKRNAPLMQALSARPKSARVAVYLYSIQRVQIFGWRYTDVAAQYEPAGAIHDVISALADMAGL